MSNGFVPLAEFLASAAPSVAPEPRAPQPAEAAAANAPAGEAIREARRFRAGLSDALDAAVQQLLPEIAREVVGRELRIARCDLAGVVAAALERYGETALALRAHPQDLDALAGLRLECLADETVEPGDLRLELRSGTIDLTLQSRLDAVLAAFVP